MSNKQYSLLAVLVVISGLLGGAASNQLFLAKPLFAGEMDIGRPTVGIGEQPVPHRNLIRTKALELTDKAGKTRAAFALTPDGEPSLVLYDKKGAPLLALASAGKGSSLLTFTGEGGTKFAIRMGPKGRPSMTINDRKGKSRLVLGVGPEENVLLGLYDKDSKSGAVISVLPGGRPGVALLDSTGKARGAFQLLDDGKPNLALNDEKGKTRLVVGRITPKFAANVLPTRSTSSMVIFDKDEKAVWQAP